MRVYGEFKLSDFGFAKFANYSNRPLSYIDGGTATYGEETVSTSSINVKCANLIEAHRKWILKGE